MVRLGSVLLLVLAAGCGGEVAPTGATLDASASAEDAGADAPWYTNFPDASYRPEAPPRPGEYPPPGGKLCAPLGPNCGKNDYAWCDTMTGWCCAAVELHGRCVCGDVYCIPPMRCCARNGDYVPECLADPDLCGGDAG